LQKGEAAGRPGHIDMLRKGEITDLFGKNFDIGALDLN
jgi:hypothetical protein